MKNIMMFAGAKFYEPSILFNNYLYNTDYYVWIINPSYDMKIEDQVCSFEQAKKLYKLGIKCFPMYIWKFIDIDDDGTDIYNLREIYTPPRLFLLSEISLPAYTVAELGMLLQDFRNDEIEFIFRSFYCYNCDSWAYDIELLFEDYEKESLLQEQAGFKTESQARAEALIWIIENKYINPKELNYKGGD